MYLNQLVRENQSIKIVPSIEDSLKNMGLDVDIDENTNIWFAQLKLKWKTWKKSAIVDDHFETFIESTADPFRVALICTIKCPEFKDCKIKSLPFYILESLYDWSKKKDISPPETLKLPAFHVAIKQRNQHFLTLVVKTYKVCTIKDSIIPIVKEMIKNDNSKQALHIVTAMELYDEISVEELLFPFILQDKANMIDEYLSQSPNQVKPLLTFLDNLLDKKFSIMTYAQNFAYEYNVCNVKLSKLHYKPLGKLVARLCNKFNIPIETCKNLSKNRTTSGLKYLIYQKYIEHNVSLSVWDDLVKDSLKNSIECAQEFIDILVGYDAQEALKWATHFNISDNDLPLSLKDLTLQESPPEVFWDENNSDKIQYYKLPFTENEIVIIDSGDKFNNLLSNLMNQSVIGMDCEWKPSFGASQSQVALMQIATYQNVYLIDTITLNIKQYTCLWNKFNKLLLENAELIKIGFGLEQDLKELKSSLIGLNNIRVKGEGLLDLGLLWKSLVNCGLTLPTSSDIEGNSLSSLVQSCFGLPLEKSEQCSNWELRPLRNTQIRYAAIDAYVLLAIYEYIKKISIEQGINFDEVCNDVMLDKKPKSTKKTKGDRTQPYKIIVQPKTVKSIKMLVESELSILLSYLRYLGIDTILMSQPMLWHDAVNLALSEERMILTSKMKFSPSVKFPQMHIFEVGKVVNSLSVVTEHIKKILKTFNVVVKQSDLLSRCIKCNGLDLRNVPQNEINEFNCLSTSPSDGIVYDNRYNSDDDDAYNNFLSDSDDDSCLYQMANTQKPKCLTSKGVQIETGDIQSLIKANKPATLCEDCGKLYWDEDLLYKTVCEINPLLPILSN